MDKATLLKGILPADTVDLPSGAGTVHVRGLTREEAVQVQKGVGKDDPDADAILERRAIARGMTDPVLTEGEVETWRRSSVAADLAAVAKRISELSNLDQNAGKGPISNSRRRRN